MNAFTKEFVAACVGFIVASLVPAIALSILSILDRAPKTSSILILPFALYPFTFVATVVFGVPAFFVASI
jgi:hypothetical protein